MSGTAGVLDAPTFRRAMSLFLESLREHRDEINSLNVYPVPDGDTGTNLVLTQEAVVAALGGRDPDESGFERLGKVVSQASLMGARGNSGVIMSQVLRGLCERMPPNGGAEAKELAAALEHAGAEAYRAVARPADGTVLTVLRDAARAARDASGGDGDVTRVVEAALAAARDSLASTREAHPDLKRAGVVDAGGKGVVLFLDSLRSALRDEPLSEPVGPLGPVGPGREGSGLPGGEPDLEFEVQFLLEARDEAVPKVRKALGELGDSLVVVGGGGLFNVHVHTNEPGRAVDVGVGAGDVRNVSIVHLKGQVQACLGGQARAVRVAEQSTALVAVAEGDGLTQTFGSLGAVVVPGGPGNNPSVGDIASAIDAAPADHVVVLPNHRNIVPAAERAAGESWKRVAVVPTLSIPSGLSAAAAFNPTVALEENADSMGEAASGCRWGEIARAERDAETPAGNVREGEWLGLVDGSAVSRGGDAAATAAEVARRLVGEETEILTVVVGVDALPDDLEMVEQRLRESFAELEVQVIRGGQPRYPFLIGAE
jgi:uncharacterized protein